MHSSMRSLQGKDFSMDIHDVGGLSASAIQSGSSRWPDMHLDEGHVCLSRRYFWEVREWDVRSESQWPVAIFEGGCRQGRREQRSSCADTNQ